MKILSPEPSVYKYKSVFFGIYDKMIIFNYQVQTNISTTKK